MAKYESGTVTVRLVKGLRGTQSRHRLSVLRTGQHLYAQLFTADGSKVLASASTVQADVMSGLKNGKNAEAAAKVGQVIAERAKAAGIEKVAFDRSGYRYHGRIKALADAAREGGLQF